MSKVLITGGCGFIGSHFVEHFLKATDWEIIVLDKLNYASAGLDRLRDINVFDEKRVRIFTTDLAKPFEDGLKKEIGEVDYIINLASESHVDNSIKDPVPFIQNNVNLVLYLLEWARELKGLKKIVQFSCYDEKTRALTTEGLKTFDQLKEGDVVFTLNPQTRKVEEQRVEKVIIQDYEGEMIKFNNGRVDMLVTPNHRMYDEKMNVIEAGKIEKRFVFPQSEGFIGKQDFSKELMYLIGIFLGDGFTAFQEKKVKSKTGLSKQEQIKEARDKKTGRFIKTGFIGKNEYITKKSWRVFLDIPENDKSRKKTEETLKVLGINYTKQKGKAGEHLYFTSEKWVKFFNQFGKRAKNKFIPRQFLEQDKELLQELFNGLIDSDGYWNKNGVPVFTTTSEKLKENICEIAIKIGLIPQVNKIYNKSIFQGRVIEGWSWQVCFRRRNKSIDTRQGGKIEKVNYKGKIWCIRVKNKNFLVERNGRYIFSGNTDEVNGTAPFYHNYSEGDRLNPGNPYSASKASQEMICRAYSNTYKLPIIITRTMNVFGERQHPEKFIPSTIRKVLNGETVIIHADPTKTKSGSRFYIHARNVAKAVHFLLENVNEWLDKIDASSGVFNIVGEKELSNLEVAQFIAKVLNKELKYEMVDFHSSRPGHDLRYALDGKKMYLLGWRLPKSLEESLTKTIQWYLNHPRWLNL